MATTEKKEIYNADLRVLHQGQGISSARLDALSDSIYAVAMTLLVLDLKPPSNIPGSSLADNLSNQLPHIVTYFLSFLTLGVLWTTHALISHWLRETSVFFIWTKIFFLMFIVLIPFSTQILAQYEYERLALVLYGLNIFICSFLLYVIWRHATKNHQLVRDNMSDHVIAWTRARLLLLSLFPLIAIGAALIYPYAGIALFVLSQAIAIGPIRIMDAVITWVAKHGLISNKGLLS